MKTAAWLFPAALALLLTACGGPSGNFCSPESCFGCCDAAGVCQTGQLVDSCGSAGNLCVTCGGGQQCDVGLCRSACMPKSCADVGASCGQIDDGCGATVECGGCMGGQTCGAGGANVCGVGTCTPKSCGGLGCGRLSDGCAAILECGTCAAGTFCGGGGPNVCGACQPKTCGTLAKNCGPVADGCGGMLECGSCTAPNVCGGGGVANVCGMGTCQPKSCAELGKNCGMVTDGCGTMISCGSCSGFTTCGGAGTANVCGAACLVTCPTGFSCSGGVCAGGNIQGLVLNEVGYTVSGKVTVNGVLPTRIPTLCGAGNEPSNALLEIARVSFYDKAQGYTAAVPIRCNTTDFSFSTLLPPGTYEVRVSRGSYADDESLNLLRVAYLAQAQLVVAAPVANLVLNEVGHTVSGKVTVNGVLPTRSGTLCTTEPGNAMLEIARVSFYDSSKGYSANVPIRCNTTDFSFSTVLPPGAYEVRVQRGAYADDVNLNFLPVSYLALAQLTVTAPVANLVLNEVGHTVSGKVTVSGAQPTRNNTLCTSGSEPSNGMLEIARVSFYDKIQGYSANALIRCSTTDFSFNTLLPPGTYEVRVSRGSYADDEDLNLLRVAYLAQAQLVIAAPVSNLVLNEVGHTVSGKVTVNGALPTRSGTLCTTEPGNAMLEIARVSFYDSTKGYSANVPIRCNTPDFGFSTLLPPGTYEVRVQRGAYADDVNLNLLPVSYLAQSQLVVAAPVTNLVLNEVGHTVSGKVTVSGALPTRSGTLCSAGSEPSNAMLEIARVSFYDSTKGYSANVPIRCNTTDFSFSTLLPPGTYDVRVSRGSYADDVSLNLMRVAYLAQSQLVVAAPIANLVLNEVGFTVSGKVTVNGVLPTRSGTLCTNEPGNATLEIARVSFYDSAKGYSANVPIRCSTTDFSFTTLLPGGTYEVRVHRGAYADDVNLNFLPVSYLAIQRLAVP